MSLRNTLETPLDSSLPGNVGTPAELFWTEEKGISDFLGICKALKANQPDAQGSGRSFTEVAPSLPSWYSEWKYSTNPCRNIRRIRQKTPDFITNTRRTVTNTEKLNIRPTKHQYLRNRNTRNQDLAHGFKKKVQNLTKDIRKTDQT